MSALLHFWRGLVLLAAAASLASTGCALFPDRIVEPQYHNPFPQLHRVAVLPFYNQSAEPTVDGEAVAIAYYNELQLIPGFEVMPVGVARQMLAASVAVLGREPQTGAEFQRLAQLLGVDAVIVGSVTEYSPYYPPRLGLSVDWYAANPGFHPIPPGYGLPWGRAEEEYIPSTLVQEAEFALAREQLKTQTPAAIGPPPDGVAPTSAQAHAGSDVPTQAVPAPPAPLANPRGIASEALPLLPPPAHGDASPESSVLEGKTPTGDAGPGLPPEWPDPRGFIPPPPAAARPLYRPQAAPIMTHTRVYHGQDAKFTERLATYYYLRDDARFGGWKGYLERPEDFTRFCCHLHVTETLAARGGAGDVRVLWRWPISRYER